jgi:hypothetical protein
LKARYLAWGLWFTFVVVLTTATYYGFNPKEGEPIKLIDALWAWSFIGFPTTGALIASRYPRRPLGWFLIAGPLLIMTGVFVSDAAMHAGVSLEIQPWMALVSTIMFSAGLSSLLLVVFFLPDGTLPQGRIRIPFRIVLVCIGAWIATSTFSPGPFEDFPEFDNPLGVESLARVFDLSGTILGPVMLAAMGLAIVAIVIRFRRTEGQQRLQLKWIALGAAGVPLIFIGIFLFERLFVDLSDAQATVPIILAILSLPLSIGIAMLKHQLFEIDQIINRALVYALVTTLLVAAYLGLVFALQLVLEPVTKESDLAVAASTLAVAALFGPMRRRIQGFIDRRFYRRKYNATVTLSEFGSRLRDEVDLAVVQDDVIAVLYETVQPAHASVWLRADVTT